VIAAVTICLSDNTRTGDGNARHRNDLQPRCCDGFGNFGDDGGFGNDFGDDFSGDDPFNSGNGGGNDTSVLLRVQRMMYLISSGRVRSNSGKMQSSSGEAFAQNLVDAIIKDGRDYRGIILAGHSRVGPSQRPPRWRS
jgi:hypothetical protein